MNNAYLAKAKLQITDPQVLSVVAARRAKQLAQGARPMIKCDAENYIDVALLEIAEGLLSYEYGPTPDKSADAAEAPVDDINAAITAEPEAAAEQEENAF